MESDGISYIGMKDGFPLVSTCECGDEDMLTLSVFDGESVFAIDPEAVKDCAWIRSAIVPEGVRSVCSDAFDEFHDGDDDEFYDFDYDPKDDEF